MGQIAIAFIDDITELTRISFFLRDLQKNINDKLDSMILFVNNDNSIQPDEISLDPLWIKETKPAIHYIPRPSTHRIAWDTLISSFVKQVQDNRENVIHINAMCKSPILHSIILLTYYLGFIPKPSTLWSGIESSEGIRFFPISLPIKISIAAYTPNQQDKNFKALYDRNYLESPKLIEALDLIAASCQIPEINLLILGEKGTGKSRIVEELVGRMKNKIVTTVICGSLSRELAMSQLFGYEKGAYTGATKNQTGLVQEAENGILFFDEVQDLPKEVQRMLVRFLQDREHRYRPVGSVKEYGSNTELIFASHLPLVELRRRLDDDLYDRISLVTAEIPPLRSIRTDIPVIWNGIWKEHNVIETLQNTPENKYLRDYFSEDSFEGNLRNLVALCKKIAIFYIQTRDLEKSCELAVFSQRSKSSIISCEKEDESSDANYIIDFSKDLKTLTHEFKRTVVEKLVKKSFTNQQIAEKLSVDEKTVRNISSGNFS